MQMLYKQEQLIEEDRLLAVQEGLLGFLVDEVINPKGRFYYDGHGIQQPSTSTVGGS